MINVNNDTTSTTRINNPFPLKFEHRTIQDNATSMQQGFDFIDSNQRVADFPSGLPYYTVVQPVSYFMDELAETGESVYELLGQLSETFKSTSIITSTDLQDIANTLSDKLDDLSESMDKLTGVLEDAVESTSDSFIYNTDRVSTILQTLDLHSESIDSLCQIVNIIQADKPFAKYTGTPSELLHSLDHISNDFDQFSAELENIMDPEPEVVDYICPSYTTPPFDPIEMPDNGLRHIL